MIALLIAIGWALAALPWLVVGARRLLVARARPPQPVAAPPPEITRAQAARWARRHVDELFATRPRRRPR